MFVPQHAGVVNGITPNTFTAVLAFDASTGCFRWLKGINSRAPVGSIAGRKSKSGYVEIGLCGKKYGAHRLAFYFTHGRWPEGEVDHINGDKSDNRPCNLRDASRSQNMANTGLRRDNTSGHRGVSFDARRQRWRAIIQRRHLGYFHTYEGAAAAYNAAYVEIFGEFARCAE